MKSVTTERFRKAFDKLPVKVKVRARAAYQLWKNNPQHKSLQFKTVHQSKPIIQLELDCRTEP